MEEETSDEDASFASIFAISFVSVLIRGGGGDGLRCLSGVSAFKSLSLSFVTASLAAFGATFGGGGGGILLGGFGSKLSNLSEVSPTTASLELVVVSSIFVLGGGGGGILPLEASTIAGGMTCSNAIVWHHQRVVVIVVSIAKALILLFLNGVTKRFWVVVSPLWNCDCNELRVELPWAMSAMLVVV